MRTINFNGIKIPAIGMGTWHMGSSSAAYNQQKKTIQYGLAHGTNVIDTAEEYGSGDSERLIGDAIKGMPRHKLFIISKFYPFHAERQQMERALDNSLERLGTNYLDLYLYHWPGGVPLATVVENMEAMKRSGKICHWGVSNFDISDMKHLIDVPNGKHVMANEDLYNLGSRGLDYIVLPWMRKHHIPLIAYAPVDQGDSHGNNLLSNPVLKSVASKHQSSAYQIMLAWAIRDGHTLAIPQTSNPKHMQSNLNAMDIKLSSDDLKKLDNAFPKPTSKQPLAIL